MIIAILKKTLLLFCLGGFLLLSAHAEKNDTRRWSKIAQDGLHDPSNKAAKILQEPSQALRVLPPDSSGNQVDWVKALRGGYISPRSQINEQGELRRLDSNVLMKNTGEMPHVLFPHRAHTEWLDCASCHDHLFKSKAGSTRITMLAILEGKFCGTCHGAVSFPLTECDRCHSVKHDKFTR